MYETKQQRGLRRFDADSRAQLGERLRSMYRSLGMTRAQCAKFLHVSERTLHNWESGKHDIPYAAYRLLRIHCGYVLPGSAWHDWQFVGDALITPEGHALKPKDAAWWSLLALRADLGQKALARLARYESGQRATAAATDSDSRAAAALAGVEAGAQLPGAAGEAAAHAVAGLVLSKTKLTRQQSEPVQCNQNNVNLIPQCHQPSESPPISKPTPAPVANAWASASMPSFVWRWTHTSETQGWPMGRVLPRKAPLRPLQSTPLPLQPCPSHLAPICPEKSADALLLRHAGDADAFTGNGGAQ